MSLARLYRRARGELPRERGAAIPEFVMVSVLLSSLFLAVLQVGLSLHIRNTLISCASEGARLGARVGSSPDEGAERTRSLIAASLSTRFAGDVTATFGEADGIEVVVVTVNAPLPVLGPFGPSGALDVSGRAFLESQ